MAEYPPESSICYESREYDEEAGKELAQWVFGLAEHAHEGRRDQTSEESWDKDMAFLLGRKMPSNPSPRGVDLSGRTCGGVRYTY